MFFQGRRIAMQPGQRKYRVLICGGRTELNYGIVNRYLTCLFGEMSIEQAEIVSGGCQGADRLGERYARDNGFDIKQFLPEWKKFGKAAGLKRNAEMIDYIRQFPNAAVIAFWDLQSKGTKFTVELAQKHGIPVYIIEYSSRSLSEENLSGLTPPLIEDVQPGPGAPELINIKTHSSQALQNTVFCEYRLEKRSGKPGKAVKGQSGGRWTERLIEKAADDFAACVGKRADFIIFTENNSEPNRYSVRLLADKLKASLLKAEMNPSAGSCAIKDKAVFRAQEIIIASSGASSAPFVQAALSQLSAAGFAGKTSVFMLKTD